MRRPPGRNPGIWLVIGREGDQVIVMSREGTAVLDDGYHLVDGDPLGMLPDSRRVATQLRRLALFPHSGVLILMGSYDPEAGVVSCFENQWACHGGLGGPQEVAFMMVESHIDWDLDRVEQATDIYPLFMGRYGPESPGEHPVEPYSG